ncbi:MAG TPA: TolC family protein, partial [Bacteroidia bacterium]|nr:TolC family protein [Bacteroidia bacterium]
MLKRVFITAFSVFFFFLNTQSQNDTGASNETHLSLDQCIVYALQHRPTVMQSQLDIAIAKKTNAINLSPWLPQVNLGINYVHYDNLPTSFSLNSLNPSGPLLIGHPGVVNSFMPQLYVTQTIFSPDVLYAANNAHLLVLQAQQSNDSTKINVVATVSKAFYSLLLTLEQINVFKEDTARLCKNLRDTYHQFVGGIVDKTDYKEAAITLNNSKAQLKQANENVRPLYATLKQMMGYPTNKEFNVNFDTAQMMKEIVFDTTQQLQFENRIEFKQLQTAKDLQKQNVKYYRSQFLPTLTAAFYYNYQYENNNSADLFIQAYPYSYITATLTFPLFTGFRRVESIQRAKLQEERLNWAQESLKSTIYTQYTTALANYKSNLYNLTAMRDNVAMAKDVYNVVNLQYKQGIVAY